MTHATSTLFQTYLHTPQSIHHPMPTTKSFLVKHQRPLTHFSLNANKPFFAIHFKSPKMSFSPLINSKLIIGKLWFSYSSPWILSEPIPIHLYLYHPNAHILKFMFVINPLTFLLGLHVVQYLAKVFSHSVATKPYYYNRRVGSFKFL